MKIDNAINNILEEEERLTYWIVFKGFANQIIHCRWRTPKKTIKMKGSNKVNSRPTEAVAVSRIFLKMEHN